VRGQFSDHPRQIAAVAAWVGFKCFLIQESWVDWPDAVHGKVGDILITRESTRTRGTVTAKRAPA
jgi:1-aminocyclopropane-1-carboxylate deaminase